MQNYQMTKIKMKENCKDSQDTSAKTNVLTTHTVFSSLKIKTVTRAKRKAYSVMSYVFQVLGQEHKVITK